MRKTVILECRRLIGPPQDIREGGSTALETLLLHTPAASGMLPNSLEFSKRGLGRDVRFPHPEAAGSTHESCDFSDPDDEFFRILIRPALQDNRAFTALN
jgi:hypothetical protein